MRLPFFAGVDRRHVAYTLLEVHRDQNLNPSDGVLPHPVMAFGGHELRDGHPPERLGVDDGPAPARARRPSPGERTGRPAAGFGAPGTGTGRGSSQRSAAATTTTTSSTASRPDMIRLRVLGSTL